MAAFRLDPLDTSRSFLNQSGQRIDAMPLNFRRIVGLTFICGALAACGDHPTASADGVRPSLDGGHTLGSGHRTDTTTTATVSTETMAGDTTGRGGHTLGSGH